MNPWLLGHHALAAEPVGSATGRSWRDLLKKWHFCDIALCRVEFRLRRDSVAKLGGWWLARNNRIMGTGFLNQ
jgi:hypothetical protein